MVLWKKNSKTNVSVVWSRNNETIFRLSRFGLSSAGVLIKVLISLNLIFILNPKLWMASFNTQKSNKLLCNNDQSANVRNSFFNSWEYYSISCCICNWNGLFLLPVVNQNSISCISTHISSLGYKYIWIWVAFSREEGSERSAFRLNLRLCSPDVLHPLSSSLQLLRLSIIIIILIKHV